MRGWILGLTLTLLLLATSAISQASSFTLLDAPADSAAEITHVLAEPDGGFTVILSSGQAQTFDASGRLLRQVSSRWLATDRFASSAGDNALSLGDRLVLLRSQAGPLPDQEFASEAGRYPACQIEHLADGRQIKAFFRERLTGWSTVASETDGGGGLWVQNQQDGELNRYAADCDFRQIPGVLQEIEHIAPHPKQKAAFFLTRSGQLGMADEHAVRWTRTLPDFWSHSRFVVPTVAVLESGRVVVPYVDSSLEPRLAAFDDSGQPLWTQSLQDDPKAIGSFARGILIAGLTSASGQTEIHLIDGSGEARWAAPVQILSVLQPANRARARFASFIGIADGNWPDLDVQHVVTVNLESGEWRVSPIDRGDRVMATLDNGDLIVGDFSQGGSSAWHPERLLRVQPGSAPEPVGLADVLVPEHVHGSRSDVWGSLIVSGGEGHTTLHLTDPQQQSLLSYRIPGSSRQENHWFLGLALNQNLACVLFERSSWGNAPTRIELHCIDRHSGQAAFAPLFVEGQPLALRPQIGEHIEIFHNQPGAIPAFTRTRIGLDGQILTVHQPFPEPFSELAFVNAVSFLDSGHTVFFTALDTLILAPDSEPERWLGVIEGLTTQSSPIRGNLPNAVVDRDRLALIGFRRTNSQHRLVEFDLNDEKINWSRNIPDGDLRTRILSRAADSWVVSDISFLNAAAEFGAERALFVHVFDDAQGALVHSHQRDIDQRLSSNMRIAGAGDQIALQAHLSGATRIDWIDVFSGELTATATLPISHEYRVVTESLPDGRLLMAGRSHGATYPQLAVSRVSAQSRQRRMDPQASRWAGSWFTPALNGQGFFIDPLDDHNQIFAAWFTFESSPTPKQRGLRWYTALGPAPGANGVSVLTLYENRGGVFDQAPITEATEIGSMRLWETIAGDLVAELRLNEQDHDLSLELTRLSPAASLDGARTWFDPASSGQGLLLSGTADDPGPLAFGWFTFDPVDGSSSETRQHWFIGLTDAAPAQGNRREARLYRTQGGIKGLQATSNTQAVGRASLRWINCNTLSLEYQFDQSDLAAGFAGRSGSTTLVAVKDCR